MRQSTTRTHRTFELQLGAPIATFESAKLLFDQVFRNNLLPRVLARISRALERVTTAELGFRGDPRAGRFLAERVQELTR